MMDATALADALEQPAPPSAAALSAALALAELGYRVHPLRYGDKRALLTDWPTHATTEGTRIREFFATWPNAGVGITTGGGLFVLDVDNKNGHDGAATLCALEAAHTPLPETRLVRTPTGGMHYYFTTAVDVRNSAGKLGDGLDIRGTGGYVVAPPTATAAGRYEVVHDVAPAPAPAWLLAAIAVPPKGKERASITKAKSRVPGTPYACAALTSACDRVANAPQGQRNDTLNAEAFGVAQLIAGGELSVEALSEIEAAAHAAGLEPREIAATMRSASTAASAKPRTAPNANSARFGIAPPTTTPLNVVDLADIVTAELPKPRYIVEALIAYCVVTLLGGHGGAGKSMLALIFAAFVACGRAWNGLHVSLGRVVYVSLEDPASVIKNRLQRILRAYDLPAETLQANLVVLDGTDCDSALGRESPASRRFETTETYEALRGHLAGASLIVIDNASDAFDGNENERRSVRAFVRSLVQLARRDAANAGVLLLAHIDKASAKFGARGNAYSGSTAWHNSARSRLALTTEQNRATLVQEKNNFGTPAAPIALRWSDDGVLVPAPSGYIDPARSMTDAADAAAVLAALGEAAERRVDVPVGHTGRRTAQNALQAFPALPAALHGATGRERFWRALARLQADGKVRSEEYQNAGRKWRERLAVVRQTDAAQGLPL